MGELVFPELHFEHSYEKENETLYKNPKDFENKLRQVLGLTV